MNKNEVMDLLELIDRCYGTKYAEDKNIFNDWYKVLKEYELQDMTQSLDTYMKYNTTYPPKVYDLTRNYQTIENKKRLDHAKTRCMFCLKVIDFGDTKHEDRCRSIEIIRNAVSRFKTQDIDKEKYRRMTDEEFDKYYKLAIKLIIENSNNKNEVNVWKKYLEE